MFRFHKQLLRQNVAMQRLELSFTSDIAYLFLKKKKRKEKDNLLAGHFAFRSFVSLMVKEHLVFAPTSLRSCCLQGH